MTTDCAELRAKNTRLHDEKRELRQALGIAAACVGKAMEEGALKNNDIPPGKLLDRINAVLNKYPQVGR